MPVGIHGTMKMIRYIRLFIRAPIALLWTLFVHYTGIRIPQLFKPNKRFLKPIGLWGKGLAWIMGVRIHQTNSRAGPMGDIIIANHMGFLDIPIILSFFPAVFVIKMEMRRVFYFGGCLQRHGHVFVDRKNEDSRKQAREQIESVLKDGDRIIVFPEGQASPDAARRTFAPYSFFLANRLNKRIEACVIDYLPDRKQLKWDINKKMVPQLVDLFGRRRIDVSIGFYPSEQVDDPDKAAQHYHDLIEDELKRHDLSHS